MNTEIAKIFSQIILADKPVRIKLLGDSITHGVGGTGFDQNGDPIVKGFARNPNGYCWANLLRDFLEKNFSCQVVNNGCTGTKIDFIIDNFDQLVDPEDDIIICTIGTNNRSHYFSSGPVPTKQTRQKEIYGKILALADKFKKAGKQIIFMSNIPASADNENRTYDPQFGELCRVVHMNDIHDLYLKTSFDKGFPLIDLYTAFLNYCHNHNLSLDDLLDDGLHPNDRGYEVMFRLILQELGIALPLPGVTN